MFVILRSAYSTGTSSLTGTRTSPAYRCAVNCRQRGEAAVTLPCKMHPGGESFALMPPHGRQPTLIHQK